MSLGIVMEIFQSSLKTPSVTAKELKVHKISLKLLIASCSSQRNNLRQ
jgi:hypothetical protein